MMIAPSSRMIIISSSSSIILIVAFSSNTSSQTIFQTSSLQTLRQRRQTNEVLTVDVIWFSAGRRFLRTSIRKICRLYCKWRKWYHLVPEEVSPIHIFQENFMLLTYRIFEYDHKINTSKQSPEPESQTLFTSSAFPLNLSWLLWLSSREAYTGLNIFLQSDLLNLKFSQTRV